MKKFEIFYYVYINDQWEDREKIIEADSFEEALQKFRKLSKGKIQQIKKL